MKIKHRLSKSEQESRNLDLTFLNYLNRLIRHFSEIKTDHTQQVC